MIADSPLAVDRARDAESDRRHGRPRLDRGPQLALERLEELVLRQARARGRRAVEDVAIGVRDPDHHLRAPEVDAHRLRHRRGLRVDDLPGRPCGSITRRCRTTASRGGGRSAPTTRSTGRAPGSSAAFGHRTCRSCVPKRQAQGRRRQAWRVRPQSGQASPPGERPLWRRVLRWVGDRRPRLAPDQLRWPSRSPRRSRRGSWSTWANTLHGNPFLAVSPQTILVIGTDIRSGQFAGADEAASKNCLDAAGSGEPPPDQLHALPLRHPDADPGRRRRLPKALDTARHARPDPGPAGEQDQLRLRDRRRQADRPHDREVPRDQRRPGGDHRLRRLSQVHRLDRGRRR